MLLNGVKHEYGSINEAIAIFAFTRQRHVDFMSSIFAVVDPAAAQKAVKQLRSAMYPEEKNDDANYIKKAKELMKKAMGATIMIKPIKVGVYGQ